MLQNETMDLPEWFQRESVDDRFDWGASKVTAVIHVVSWAAVQMSVFYPQWSKTSPLWTDTHRLFPEITKKRFIKLCCKDLVFDKPTILH